MKEDGMQINSRYILSCLVRMPTNKNNKSTRLRIQSNEYGANPGREPIFINLIKHHTSINLVLVILILNIYP